jgi:hypothetical protein
MAAAITVCVENLLNKSALPAEKVKSGKENMVTNRKAAEPGTRKPD